MGWPWRVQEKWVPQWGEKTPKEMLLTNGVNNKRVCVCVVGGSDGGETDLILCGRPTTLGSLKGKRRGLNSLFSIVAAT